MFKPGVFDEIPDAIPLGEILKEYRKEHKISVKQCTQALGISRAYLFVLEKNYSPTTGAPVTPSSEIVIKAAALMKMDPVKLMQIIGYDVQRKEPRHRNGASIRPFGHIPPTRDNLQAALNEGRILILPFKVPKEGSKVYVWDKELQMVLSGIVSSNEGGVYKATFGDGKDRSFSIFDVGHEVFYTQKEAAREP